MRRLSSIVVAVLAALILAGCSMQPLRTMDNGAAGKEGWNVPVPTWPSFCCPDKGG